MQDKIAQIILDSCSDYMVLGKVAPQIWYQRAAAAIDQAYEQKTARLQAQVVVMTKAIGIYLREGSLCDTCYEDGCTAFGVECECGCHSEIEAAEIGLREALSAAPRMLYSYEAKVHLSYINRPQTHFVPTAPKVSGQYPAGIVSVLGVTGEHGEKDEVVSVIVVLTRPAKGEQEPTDAQG